MELRHLRFFIAAAEEDSLTLAAKKRLHTAQPSLSRQIRDLECEVGVELISRLDRIEDLRLPFRQVAREIAQERSLAETSFIAVEDNPGGRRWRRKWFCQRRVVLS